MGVEKEFHSDLAGIEHLPDLGIPFEDVLRNRELSLQCADQWPNGRTLDRDDTHHGPPIAGQFNRRTSFGAAKWALASATAICMRRTQSRVTIRLVVDRRHSWDGQPVHGCLQNVKADSGAALLIRFTVPVAASFLIHLT